MTGAPDPAAALAALYPSATKPEPGTTSAPAPKQAATSPEPGTTAAKPVAAPTTAAKPSPGTWQTPGAQPAAETPQAAKPAEPAGLYVEPLRDMQKAVAATPIPDEDAAHFDQGDEGKQAREAVRSAFLTAGASKEETGELWGYAVEAARPSYSPPSFEDGEAALRRAWPAAEYDARLRRAQSFMREVARKHPAAAAEVRKLGLDNDARFIAAIEKAARRRGR